jgi:hypothetical protein
MKKTITILFFAFLSFQIFAKNNFIVGIVRDMETHVRLINVKVDFADSSTLYKSTDYTDGYGLFYFQIPVDCKVFTLKAYRPPHDCDDGYIKYSWKYHITNTTDTIHIDLKPLMVELRTPCFIFKNNSFLFKSIYDTLSESNLLVPDSTDNCFVNLDYFAESLNCNQYAMIVIDSYYSKTESSDIYARMRAEYIEGYLVKRGVAPDRFIITTRKYAEKPTRNADGTIHPDMSTVRIHLDGR